MRKRQPYLGFCKSLLGLGMHVSCFVCTQTFTPECTHSCIHSTPGAAPHPLDTLAWLVMMERLDKAGVFFGKSCCWVLQSLKDYTTEENLSMVLQQSTIILCKEWVL